MTQTELSVLIAPSAYKGSLTSLEISQAIRSGLSVKLKTEQIKSIPLADGGDGTITMLQSIKGGAIRSVKVKGPLEELVNAYWLQVDNTAVIELAVCCGLGLIIDRQLKPLLAHTYGLGEMIAACLPCNKIIIGLGGSASTDGGTGALAALGVRFLDVNNRTLPLGGKALLNLAKIDTSTLKAGILEKEIDLLADVNIPLLGAHGAANIFARQKGADEEDVAILEASLQHFSNKVAELTNVDLKNMPGCGAAGGTAFGLASLINGHIKPGFITLARMVNLEKQIRAADVVITAEGKLDEQSFQGKATGELVRLCKSFGKPIIVLPAVCDNRIDWQRLGISAVYTTAESGGRANSVSIRNIASSLSLPIKE